MHTPVLYHQPKADLRHGLPHVLIAPQHPHPLQTWGDLVSYTVFRVRLDLHSKMGRSALTLWISLMKKQTTARFLHRVIQRYRCRNNEATEMFLAEMAVLRKKKKIQMFWGSKLAIRHLNVPFKPISIILNHEDHSCTSTYNSSTPFCTTSVCLVGAILILLCP